MKINEITINRAVSWNNGKPGGKEFWVIHINGNQKEPWVCESTDFLLGWLRERLCEIN